jgi:hypothetical protein
MPLHQAAHYCAWPETVLRLLGGLAPHVLARADGVIM